MKRSGLNKELFLSHVGVALISLVVITLLVNVAVYVFFGGYVRTQQKAELQVIAEELSEAYTARGGWPAEALMSVSHQAMMRGFAIRIADAQGALVWDSSMMNRHMQMPMPMTENGRGVSSPIMKGGIAIGSVELAGSAGYSDRETMFLRKINWWIWAAFFLVVIGVYLLSQRLSLRISRPLLSIRETANRMTAGELKARVRLSEGQHEIRELGEALNHIAHELRTPVAAIRSHVEAFQDGIWEATPEKLEVCHSQIMQLALLIQDLEKLSEAENPMLKLTREELNLVSVIREAQAAVAEAAEGKAQIRFVPPEQQEVRCVGDRRRLQQIFANLIGNAYKYTPAGGTVAVRIAEEDHGDGTDRVVVRVVDTGPGIREEELPYIFERFYRGDKSRNRKLGGAGIGLAVVKALVEAHGGEVAVESVSGMSNEPSGTTFTVKLPKAKS
jgi:two-component system, OmpR family, sensor histidine kinase BaeS